MDNDQYRTISNICVAVCVISILYDVSAGNKWLQDACFLMAVVAAVLGVRAYFALNWPKSDGKRR